MPVSTKPRKRYRAQTPRAGSPVSGLTAKKIHATPVLLLLLAVMVGLAVLLPLLDSFTATYPVMTGAVSQSADAELKSYLAGFKGALPGTSLSLNSSSVNSSQSISVSPGVSAVPSAQSQVPGISQMSAPPINFSPLPPVPASPAP